MAETTFKEQMLQAIERLPETATLDDVAHLVEMHRILAEARAQSAAGRKNTPEQARERFGLPVES